MKRYDVIVRTLQCKISYTAIGSSSCAVAEVAMDLFGVCGVFVQLQVRS